MRSHHEELGMAASIVPALTLLIPFTGALAARILGGRKQPTCTKKGDL